MINYFGLDILLFPLTFIIFLNYIFGIYNIGKKIESFVYIENNEIKILFYFCILSIIILLTSFFIIQNILYAKYFTYLIFLFFFIINLINIRNINLKKIFLIKTYNIDIKIIIFFLVCYFVIGSLPLSDADSLSYHSSYGAHMLKYQSSEWLKNVDLVHPDFLLSGFTEIFNLIGLILFSENFGSYFNIFSLVLIYLYFIKNFNGKKEFSFILLSIISSPIILPMVFSQKIYILPSFILALIFFNIYKSKKLSLINEIIILSSLMLILSFKVSFLYPTIIAIFYMLYRNKKIYRTFGLSIVTGLVFFIPLIIKNYYYHVDFIPPFTGQILNTNADHLNIFAEFLKNYDLRVTLKNLIFLPILFLIPHHGLGGSFLFSLPNIGKIYGIQSLIFFKKKFFLNKEITFIFILLFVSVIFTGNISTRWFLFIFFLMLILLCHLNIKITNFLKKVIYLQTILFGFFIFFYTMYALPSLISKNYRENFLKKHSNGYDFTVKVNAIKNKFDLKNDEKILFEHRSRFWTDINNSHLNISNQWLPLFKKNKSKLIFQDKLKDLVRDEKIKILVIRKKVDIVKLLNNSILDKCKYKFGNFRASHSTRNPFFSGVKNYNWIYFEKFHLNECLKND